MPVEILRTVHSFDPCMACGVHVVDGRGREPARVRAACAAAHPTRVATDPAREARYPLRVWDLCVRLTHWGMALSLFVLAATGYYLGDPFVSVPGEAGQRFVMGHTKAVHLYAGIVFTLSVLSRLVWMFLGGGYASWRQFVPVTRARLARFVETLRFYTFLRVDGPGEVGHSPVAGVAYLAVYGLCLVQIATGLALWGANQPPDSWLRAKAIRGFGDSPKPRIHQGLRVT